MNESNLNHHAADQYVSKSQKKRDSRELQDLGAELAKLSDAQLDGLALPSELKEALCAAKTIKQHGALKRQLKFIGGLMRGLNVDPIREQLAGMKLQSGSAVRQHHRVERWRDRLIAEGDSALSVLMSEVSDIDRQKVRQLIRNARHECNRGKPPRAARGLYRYLKETLQ